MAAIIRPKNFFFGCAATLGFTVSIFTMLLN